MKPQATHSILITTATLFLAGCADDFDSPIDEGRSDYASDVRYADNGWDHDDRSRAYSLSEGSRLVPKSWFLALTDESGTTLSQLAQTRYGYLSNPNDPEALPLGFTRDEDDAGETWVGLNCSACHTSELRLGAARVRIDGAPSMGDLNGLMLQIQSLVELALEDETRLSALASAIGSTDTSDLRAKLADYNDDIIQRLRWLDINGDFDSIHVQDDGDPAYGGPGRADGIQINRNETNCFAVGMHQNCLPYSGPTSYPYLWGAADLNWVQSNALVHSVLGRNVAQASGTFAQYTFADGKLKSSVDVGNVIELEELSSMLKAPNWNDKVFAGLLKPIDKSEGSAWSRGRDLYAENCVHCHYDASIAEVPRTEPNAFGKTFIDVISVPASVIGTDDTFIKGAVYAQNELPEFLRGLYVSSFGEETIRDTNMVSAGLLKGVFAKLLVGVYFAEEQIAPGSPAFAQAVAFREDKTPPVEQIVGYMARPLHGVAFSGPYLHNGSVRSLYQLLLPPEQRESSFYVGSYEFDADEVGFVNDASAPAATYLDATYENGNSNAGHIYGTNIVVDTGDYAVDQAAEEAARRDLLEYLKAL